MNVIHFIVARQRFEESYPHAAHSMNSMYNASFIYSTIFQFNMSDENYCNSNDDDDDDESSDGDESSDSDSAVAVRKVKKKSELEWRIQQDKRERVEHASSKGVSADDIPGTSSSSTKPNEAPPTQHKNKVGKIASNKQQVLCKDFPCITLLFGA